MNILTLAASTSVESQVKNVTKLIRYFYCKKISYRIIKKRLVLVRDTGWEASYVISSCAQQANFSNNDRKADRDFDNNLRYIRYQYLYTSRYQGVIILGNMKTKWSYDFFFGWPILLDVAAGWLLSTLGFFG